MPTSQLALLGRSRHRLINRHSLSGRNFANPERTASGVREEIQIGFLHTCPFFNLKPHSMSGLACLQLLGAPFPAYLRSDRNPAFVILFGSDLPDSAQILKACSNFFTIFGTCASGCSYTSQ